MDALLHLFHNDHGEWQVVCLLLSDGWLWFRIQVAVWTPRISSFFT